MTIIETIMNGKKDKERLNPFGCKGLVMVLRGPFLSPQETRKTQEVC